jgi:hypothetical protein
VWGAGSVVPKKGAYAQPLSSAHCELASAESVDSGRREAGVGCSVTLGGAMLVRFRASILLVALAVLLAGCGEGAERLSKAEFIEQWDSICHTYNDRRDRILEDLPAEPTVENLPQFADVLRKLAPVVREGIAELKKVRPPEADQAVVESILADVEESADRLDDAADAAESGDLETFVAAAQSLAESNQRVKRAVADYGLQECGR